MDYLKENLFHLCKRVWPNANKLTANMDRTGPPDSYFPSISCHLGVSVFLEESHQRGCLVKLGEMTLGSSLPPPQTLQEQDFSI